MLVGLDRLSHFAQKTEMSLAYRECRRL